MTKEFSAARLDLKSFAEAGVTLQGEEPVSALPRLFDETQARTNQAPVRWSATGELRNPRHVHPEIWLHLDVDAVLALTCQRCLGRVEVPVSVGRDFRFASDEAAAAAEDEEAEEDVLALDPSFNLLVLMEDELLMEMPLAPRHETCPEPVVMEAVDEKFEGSAVDRPNPFAVLGKLKNGKS